VDEFRRDPGGEVRLAARKQPMSEAEAAGKEAVLLDLDDPKTFGRPSRVDRLFLLTATPSPCFHQSKTSVDGAVKAGSPRRPSGIFANWDTTDPHFAGTR